MSPEAKRAHLVDENNFEAKLSDLHESVLSRILSYLPTVEAVRTCVLSKTWRTMWTTVTDLRFADTRHSDPTDYGFIEFVDRVVGHVASPKINSFHLHSLNSYDDETPLISWLSKLLECNLQRLVITWYELETVNFTPLLVSLGFLVELRLRTRSILDISAPALLPNLRFFSLEDARIFNTSSVSTNLVLNFPVLETFEASRCRWFRTDTVIVHSPLLRVFEMFVCRTEHVPNKFGVCTISVLASKLEKVTFSGHGSKNIILSFPPSLPDAYLALSGPKWPIKPQWPKKFLHSFTCVTSLGLQLSRDYRATKIPKFRQLFRLDLTYDMTNASILRRFLKSAPVLRMLSIRDLTSEPTLKSCLKELRSREAPACVRTMLKVLEIRNFKTQEPQLTVLRSLVANAEILGSVILSTTQPITKQGKALVLSYPKASRHAAVIFD